MLNPSAQGLKRRALLAAACALATTGCGSSNDNLRVNLPPPTESTKVGPGDIVVLEVFGEKELPREYQVASDGSINIPYLHAVPVAGLEPQAIAGLIRKLLIEKQILSDPSVVVRVKEYNSRRIMIMGQVAKPGVFSYTTGLTLIQALSQAGGPTGIANLNRVNLTRRTEGGSRTVVLSIGPIMEGRSADIPLQAGDSIFVHERIF